MCRKKKYHLYRTYRKHHIFIYFLRKVIFHIPFKEKISHFWEKEMPSLLVIQERSYSSAIFLEAPSFQNIWKKKIRFFVQCVLVSFAVVTVIFYIYILICLFTYVLDLTYYYCYYYHYYYF